MTEEEARFKLENMVQGFKGTETEKDIMKNAAFFDAAAGIHNRELTEKVLYKLTGQEPENASILSSAANMPQKQDVIQTTIEFYDTKARAKRLLLIADVTENKEYVCFNITSAKKEKDNEKYPANVLILKTPENHLQKDSSVQCDVEYIISTNFIYTDLKKTPIRLNNEEFSKIMARYQLLKSEKKTDRIQNSAGQKKEEFEKLKRQVIATAEAYKREPKMIAELVDFRSKFYKYSLRNNLLLRMQNKFATYVASFKKWNSLGYHVNKGEKGLKVIVPYDVLYYKKGDNWKNVRTASREELSKIYRNEIETRKETYFTVGYVFDISQTDCPQKDYPKFYDMGYESAGHAVLYEALKGFAEKSGFSVTEDKIDSIALKGFYRPADDSITINDKLNDSEKLSTLTHEFSHALMHKTSTQPKEVVEFEAECLSHMFLRRLNMPLSDSNKDYIATYYSKVKTDKIELEKSFQRISKAFNHATGGLDGELKERGIDISPSIEQQKEQKQSVEKAETVNQNFLRGLE